MFVRPEQVAEFVDSSSDIIKARLIVDRNEEKDNMTVMVETTLNDSSVFNEFVQKVFKLRGELVICSPGTLPKDGLVIEDKRSYD